MSAKIFQKFGRLTLKKTIWLIIAMIVLVVVALMFYTRPVYVVTLDNNQVYFGNVDDSMFSDFLTLDNAYYIEQSTASTTADGRPTYAIRRIESELLGPRKKMQISKEHILMYQELRQDSSAMGAIFQDSRRGR